MTSFRITAIFLLVLAPGLAACTAAPEERLRSAIDSLCSGDGSEFRQTLSADSRHLFAGLAQIAPEAFGCSSREPVRLEQLEARRQDVRYFKLHDAQRSTRIAMILEEGEWRIDLYFSEEAEYFLQNAGDGESEESGGNYAR